jgi:hypothetical protein
MSKVVTLILLLLPIHAQEAKPVRVYKYRIEVDGRVYPTDSIWQDKKRTLWIGADGIWYGIETKKL